GDKPARRTEPHSPPDDSGSSHGVRARSYRVMIERTSSHKPQNPDVTGWRESGRIGPEHRPTHKSRPLDLYAGLSIDLPLTIPGQLIAIFKTTTCARTPGSANPCSIDHDSEFACAILLAAAT